MRVCDALVIYISLNLNAVRAKKVKDCNPPPPMKYVIGLDASKSMSSDGWAAAVRFANAFIDYSLQGDSEVLLYYFNGLLAVCMCASVW